jgi:hypothetical protein
MKINDTGFAAQASHLVQVIMILFVINKSAEVNPIIFAQVLEQMIGAYLVPLVRWIGKPVDEIKKLLHRDYPRFLTI